MNRIFRNMLLFAMVTMSYSNIYSMDRTYNYKIDKDPGVITLNRKFLDQRYKNKILNDRLQDLKDNKKVSLAYFKEDKHTQIIETQTVSVVTETQLRDIFETLSNKITAEQDFEKFMYITTSIKFPGKPKKKSLIKKIGTFLKNEFQSDNNKGSKIISAPYGYISHKEALLKILGEK